MLVSLVPKPQFISMVWQRLQQRNLRPFCPSIRMLFPRTSWILLSLASTSHSWHTSFSVSHGFASGHRSRSSAACAAADAAEEKKAATAKKTKDNGKADAKATPKKEAASKA